MYYDQHNRQYVYLLLLLRPFAQTKVHETTAPVDNVAGFPPVPAVSPFKPGSVSAISNSTKFGGVTAIGLLFHSVKVQNVVFN